MLKLIQLASSEVALSAEFMEAANADQLPSPPHIILSAFCTSILFFQTISSCWWLPSWNWLSTASWFARFVVFFHLGGQMIAPLCLENTEVEKTTNAIHVQVLLHTGAYISQPVLKRCSESQVLAFFLSCSAPCRPACISGVSPCREPLVTFLPPSLRPAHPWAVEKPSSKWQMSKLFSVPVLGVHGLSLHLLSDCKSCKYVCGLG